MPDTARVYTENRRKHMQQTCGAPRHHKHVGSAFLHAMHPGLAAPASTPFFSRSARPSAIVETTSRKPMAAFVREEAALLSRAKGSSPSPFTRLEADGVPASSGSTTRFGVRASTGPAGARFRAFAASATAAMVTALPPFPRLAHRARARQSFFGSFSESVSSCLSASESDARQPWPPFCGASTPALHHGPA